MARVSFSIWLGVATIAATLVGCDPGVTPAEPPPPPTLDVELRQAIGNWGVVPIGPMPAQDPALVRLGRALFFDKILSGNRDIACATCHDPSASLGDGLSLAVGTGGTGLGITRTLGPGRPFVSRNAPSLLNAGLGLYQMLWDGRLSGIAPGPFQADDGPVLPNGLPNLLAAQAMLPVVNRREMRGEASDHDVQGQPNELGRIVDGDDARIWRAAMDRLLAVSEYVTMFGAAFPSEPRTALRFEHAARALAAFQMEAFTKTRSPFDRYLERDDMALTVAQKRGGILFFGKARCSSCHNGPFLGAQQVANVGAPQLGPGGSRQPPADLGRGETQDDPFYRFGFRVAPLRNVELTAPYMHSGAFASLESVVRHYNDVPTSLREYDGSELAAPYRAAYQRDARVIEAVLSTLDGRLRPPIGLTTAEMSDLVAFLKALTDPAARNLSHLIPATVPSGLPVR